jgi:hypothetical protein
MSGTVQVRCLCGNINESIDLAKPPPHAKHVCHCNHCRYTTGVLFLSVLPLTEKPFFVDRLCRYDSSDKVSRYFCGDCGSHMICHVIKDDFWGVCSGAIDKFEGDSLESYTAHEFIGDTHDGGLGLCFLETSGQPVEFWMQGPDEPSTAPKTYLEQVSTRRTATGQISLSEKLSAGCHCGNVQYRITRPNDASKSCSSPWPDLIVPSSSGHSDNPEDAKWWLTDNGTKYLAGTCACRSCRLASGVPVQTWAFIPKANIQQPDGSPWEFARGSLKQYKSSSGVFREFCNVCGATAFWHCEERPDLIDVSVGLLRATEGSRAETWLQWWTKRVSFREEALDRPLIDRLERGLPLLQQ